MPALDSAGILIIDGNNRLLIIMDLPGFIPDYP